MFGVHGPWGRRPWECVPLPAALLRTAVLTLVLVFVLVLLRWGYDARTCLVLVSGVGLVAVQVSNGLARATRPRLA